MKSKQRIAIVGAGPAGCICAYYLQKNFNVTLFDSKSPLHTLLYTGGGRCNLAYAEFDFRELAKFYPRGEKFLYSVFSQFSTSDTIDFFDEIGVKTYVQDDLRVFPQSNSAKELREKLLSKLKACSFKKEKAIDITSINEGFSLKTNDSTYFFDKIVISVGGHAGYSLVKHLGHKIIEPKPALTGLISEQNFKSIQGVSLKNIKAEISWKGKKFPPVQDDLLFTHEGISGPLAYKISSVCARLDYNKQNPLIIKLNLLCHAEFISGSKCRLGFQPNNNEAYDNAILKQVQDDVLSDNFYFQDMLNSNPKKDIKNLVSELVPKSLAEYILAVNNIGTDVKCCDINGKTRDLILKSLSEFEINVISSAKDGEVVTSGGVCLDEINPKTMQSKLIEGVYFCGEVVDVDGFCGGFNLQNCWSTGYIVAKSIKENF